MDRLRELHGRVASSVARLNPAGMERKALVLFVRGEPYRTSATDIIGWRAGHYLEHVPHIRGLLSAWNVGAAT